MYVYVCIAPDMWYERKAPARAPARSPSAASTGRTCADVASSWRHLRQRYSERPAASAAEASAGVAGSCAKASGSRQPSASQRLPSCGGWAARWAEEGGRVWRRRAQRRRRERGGASRCKGPPFRGAGRPSSLSCSSACTAGPAMGAWQPARPERTPPAAGPHTSSAVPKVPRPPTLRRPTSCRHHRRYTGCSGSRLQRISPNKPSCAAKPSLGQEAGLPRRTSASADSYDKPPLRYEKSVRRRASGARSGSERPASVAPRRPGGFGVTGRSLASNGGCSLATRSLTPREAGTRAAHLRISQPMTAEELRDTPAWQWTSTRPDEPGTPAACAAAAEPGSSAGSAALGAGPACWASSAAAAAAAAPGSAVSRNLMAAGRYCRRFAPSESWQPHAWSQDSSVHVHMLLG
jgi:hypothetical protein